VHPGLVDLLGQRRPASAVVIGGDAVIGQEVIATLSDRVAQVSRVGGGTRLETSVALHRRAVGLGLFSPNQLWLASSTDEALSDALSAAPAIAARGASLLLVYGPDLTVSPPTLARLAELRAGLRDVVLLGGVSAIRDDAPVQLDKILNPREVPGGGRSLLPDRQLVALYGSHVAPGLGVLGERPVEELGPLMAAYADPYRALSDRPVVGVFDLIVTLATREDGQDGLYRKRSFDHEIQPYLDQARAQDAYLLLDIQPGRSDFLTEATVYEAFLRQPDVGLALDPEWRTDPPNRPGLRVGTVDAAELNALTGWLARLVREEQLPDKLVVIHQFRDFMVTGREAIIDRPGIQLVFQMDGEGPSAPKISLYQRLLVAAPFFNGFMIFNDQDPDPLSPQAVLGLDPVPNLVSYQ
jgi:hypothetical protein